MTREIDNALLMHGGTDEIDIPGAALQKIISDALKPDCDDRYAALQRQVEALEEANKRLADERDYYKQMARDSEARAMGKEYD